MDPIADMIIRIKNAGESRKDTVAFPYSNLKASICKTLLDSGYIKSLVIKGKIAKSIEVGLIYNGKFPKIQGVKRLSKPSRRLYKASSDLRPVKRGYGSLIMSTPKGIMVGEHARKSKVGGEALFEIW
jgi:small subunit ribosomal protein S8